MSATFVGVIFATAPPHDVQRIVIPDFDSQLDDPAHGAYPGQTFVKMPRSVYYAVVGTSDTSLREAALLIHPAMVK